MFFQDLTPYTYSRAVCSGHVLNIGWLSRDVPFQTGDTKDEFLRTLKLLAENPVRLCAGQHECEFCDIRQFEIPAGNGEIHVPAADRTVTYAAPQLVPHYVEAHRYFPPAVFIEAVLAYGAPELPWEALRTLWTSQLPPLDGQWKQWRFFQDGVLVEIHSAHELSIALDLLQRKLAEILRIGTSRDFKVEVLRSCRNPQSGAIEIEQDRHEINCGPFSPSLRSCSCHA